MEQQQQQQHSRPSPSNSTPPCLPKPTNLSISQLNYLKLHFQTHQDLLLKAPHLHTSLLSHSSLLHSHLHRLKSTLSHLTVSWIRQSFSAKASLSNLHVSLQNLSLITSQGGSGWRKMERVLGSELPQLVKEVQRIENIRSYLEITLQLEALVGDLEDAVFCFVNSHSGKMFSAMQSKSSNSETKQEKLLQAIKALNDLEMLVGLVNLRPQWHHLLKSVDARVDKTLGILRPQVIADHRALLASFGWPPKLSAWKQQCELSGLPNPLVSMQEEQRKSYSDSFLALCALQHIQTRRENRQLNLSGKKCMIQLWGMDELVAPIASRMEYHFSKWVDQPEFIFELAYKTTRDFIAGVDDVLQPLIDRAKLSSYSAKEAWVSSIVQPLSDFLAKRLFSSLAERYKEKEMKSEVIRSWLHLIDLIVLFDKRIQSLLKTETSLFSTHLERVDSLSGNTSVLIIFNNRPDWLKIWAKIELNNSCDKLKTDLKDERAWTIDGKEGAEFPCDTQPFLISTREDHKAPLIAESALKITWEMVERCQTMPVMLLRVQFIRSTAVRFLWYFFKVLVVRYKRTEITPENLDDMALVRVCGSINAAKYIESKLRQWCDNVDFLEMKLAENDTSNRRKDKMTDLNFFAEEIQSLSDLATNWLMEIISVLLHQFENLSWEYVQKMKHYHQQSVDASAAVDLTISVDFVEPLDALRCHLIFLRTVLNATDFLDLWRSLAEGLDHFISGSDIASGIRFSDRGINQFETDMEALFSLFQPFCVRPEAFFPSVREITKLLKMKEDEEKKNVKKLQAIL